MRTGIISRMLPLITVLLSTGIAYVCVAADYHSIEFYLPSDAVLDGSVDYSQQIQNALDKHVSVVLPGSGDPDNPLVYGIKIDPSNRYGILVPAGHTLKAEPGAVIRRIPSAGTVVRLGKGARLIGLHIDGNKAAHWPEFQDLGKGDFGVLMLGNNLVEDCVVFDNPGIAFGTYADGSVVRRCVARNVGYIDLKFNADYYQGKWDKWSADGFYMRGHDNTVIDCHAIDCFRWGYTTCHEKAGRAIYINCTATNPTWRTYGFIDIEGCDGGGSILINCTTTDGVISVSTDDTKLYNCVAEGINVYNTDNVEIIGCTTNGGGLAVGGWSSAINSAVRGGNNPIVVGNTINKYQPNSGVGQTSDWSFSVFSADGQGTVTDNIINEYQGKAGKGPGMKIDNLPADGNNVIHYGTSHIPEAATNNKTAKKSDAKQQLRQRKMQAFAIEARKIATDLGIKEKIAGITLANPEAQFIKDTDKHGEEKQWYQPTSRPKDVKPIRLGEHWDSQYGQYHGQAWYFAELPLDMDHRYICDEVYLLFGGVDSFVRVYVNGQFVGEHDGWKDPFVMSVPMNLLRWDENEPNDLTLQVSTPAGLGGVYGHVAAILVQNAKDAATSPIPKPSASNDAASAAKTKAELQDTVSRSSKTYKPFAVDFSDPKALQSCYIAKRVSYREKQMESPLLLLGGGAIVTRQNFGPGTYSVRFKADGSHENFQYHVPTFVFNWQNPEATKAAPTANTVSEFLAIRWLASGQVHMVHQPAEGKAEKLAEWQQPGPAPETRIADDELIDLTIRVPEPGGQIEVYLNKATTEGEPDCTFEMPGDVGPGAFGFLNPKWYSRIWIQSLEYQP